MRILNGAWNFRDVADAPGSALRPGKFFRSSELTALDDEGRAVLRSLGITDVADLRSRREVERRGPGRVPDDVTVHLLPFPDLASDGGGESPHEHAFNRMMTEAPSDQSVGQAAREYMIAEYRRFPTFPGAGRAVRQVISLLAADRPVVTHCFAGKDRTGFTVALILEAVGVDTEVIISDYLQSNDAVGELRDRIVGMVNDRAGSTMTPEAMTFAEARLTDEVLGVHEEYLAAAREAIDQSYGSLDGYLRAADISEADIDAVRSVLLA